MYINNQCSAEKIQFIETGVIVFHCFCLIPVYKLTRSLKIGIDCQNADYIITITLMATMQFHFQIIIDNSCVIITDQGN